MSSDKTKKVNQLALDATKLIAEGTFYSEDATLDSLVVLESVVLAVLILTLKSSGRKIALETLYKSVLERMANIELNAAPTQGNA